jgi:alginate O-acetyltransferase complex protein AlgI
MLFTTATFAFVFLPMALTGFFVVARWSHVAAASWLFAISLLFYAFWMPVFTSLLLGSMCANFFIGSRIGRSVCNEPHLRRRQARLWLIAGIILNLSLLGYFKYANFFVDNLSAALNLEWNFTRVILPIGISFYTFTQIAFLADAYEQRVHEYRFSHYGLFVTYFPHLIAGPVLHHAQMMPQFRDGDTYRINSAHIAAGLGIFTIGLIKKVVFADGISPFSDTVFSAADKGLRPNFTEAWLGALAYTFQLYFDFSGYTDMAIGLSLLFNIRLPYNFDSPYRSLNISEFWRRWHITLSTFLRDYLYIPLGGNKHGTSRRYGNLLITMVLGGLWHGASWTFVFWGALHGIYLTINHGFRALAARYAGVLKPSRTGKLASWVLTMIAVVVAWVFFRAESFSGAWAMLSGMMGANSLRAAPEANPLLWNAGLHADTGFFTCVLLCAVACMGTNSNRIGEAMLTACKRHEAVRYPLLGASVAASIFLVIVNEMRSSVSAFIYFNF